VDLDNKMDPIDESNATCFNLRVTERDGSVYSTFWVIGDTDPDLERRICWLAGHEPNELLDPYFCIHHDSATISLHMANER